MVQVHPVLSRARICVDGYSGLHDLVVMDPVDDADVILGKSMLVPAGAVVDHRAGTVEWRASDQSKPAPAVSYGSDSGAAKSGQPAPTERRAVAAAITGPPGPVSERAASTLAAVIASYTTAMQLMPHLSKAKYFSKLDLRSGYHQVLLRPEGRELTAFVTPLGHYQWNVMPSGEANAPATFVTLVNQLVLKDYTILSLPSSTTSSSTARRKRNTFSTSGRCWTSCRNTRYSSSRRSACG